MNVYESLFYHQIIWKHVTAEKIKNVTFLQM